MRESESWDMKVQVEHSGDTIEIFKLNDEK